MNIKDCFMEFILTAKDRLMDVVTFGVWSKVHGEVTWMKMEVKSK